MRNRIFAVLAIAVLAGTGLAYGTYNFVNNNQRVETVATPTEPVVVAAADIAIGSEIKSDDVQVLNFPAGQAPQGKYSSASEVVGKSLIVSIVKGEPILQAKLASKEAGVGLPP